MIVYPALDLRNGRVVRLDDADYTRETRYPGDPLELAREFRRAGATWLHVVDLDAARLGRFMELDTLAAIAHGSGLQVQAGGGVRSASDIETLLEAGAARVSIGSTAVRQPDLVAPWIQRFGPQRICVALDTRADEAGAWRLPVAGWTQDTGLGLFGLLERLALDNMLEHVLSTDIARDGMLEGPNLALYSEIRRRFPRLQLQASGGVRSAADVLALERLGVAGVIVGKALLERCCTLDELMPAPC